MGSPGNEMAVRRAVFPFSSYMKHLIIGSFEEAFQLINVISLLSLIGLTGYTIILTHRYKQKLTCMAAMMIAMTAGMMSSLLLGTVLGTLYEGRLFVPTVLSMLVGMVVGFCTGKPISLMAALDGLLAGIMGGMMGAMLGVMITNEAPEKMTMVMNAIFIVVMLLIIRLIKEETGVIGKKDQPQHQKENFNLSKPLLLLFPVMVFFLPMVVKESGVDVFKWFAPSETTGSQSKVISAVQKAGYQEATIYVGQYGYEQEEVKLKAGVPTKLRFQKNYPGGCLAYLIMKDFNIQQVLKQGETTVEFKPDKPGKYTFTCGMGMYSGTIVVEL